MSADPEYDHYKPDEFGRLAVLYRHAFGIGEGRARQYVDSIGEGSFRVVRRAGTLVGAVAFLEMGHWFGGKLVPCRGIAGVAVEPAERGRGTATRMMAAAVEETRADGFPISSLYPATLPLYQRAGYAKAGDRMTYRLPLTVLHGLRPDPLLERAEDPADRTTIIRLQSERARRTNGLLERCNLLWERAIGSPERPCSTWFVPGADGPEGYVTVGARSDHDRSLQVQDWAALSPRAGRALLAFLGGWHSQVSTITWNGGPEDTLIHLLPEVGAGIASWEQWMLRITDVAGVLTARGWPPGLTMAVTLSVTDPLLATNNGRFRLEMAAGQATVERVGKSGAADLTLGIDALATLYTGHLAPRVMADLGMMEATPAGLAAAGMLFAGPRPWLPDTF